ncbi:COQ9 family protein [Asticcacaulis sp. AND118]|uniref:COQ9 family protein n=1 Tax=Asticcacaulis sp. AND118 TaxID=2840468 RepID=UPI001CFF857B|nr:COQ9 family protein [Asticcacaulis sp. AND118]UDF04946.1 COQ9 family protein [Asticcacaulis sp. AND118]
MSPNPIAELEQSLAATCADLMPELGLTSVTVRAAATRIGLNAAEVELVCPNGPSDIAAILWRQGDAALETEGLDVQLAAMKVRERIDFLLNRRIDAGAENERATHRLIGHLCLPQHLGLYRRLLWDSADLVWRKAGDKALDENHYSKRAIVSGILATALMTRLTQGVEAQHEQIARNIDQVMAFEKFKAKLPLKPEDALLGAVEFLGKLRFGTAA